MPPSTHSLLITLVQLLIIFFSTLSFCNGDDVTKFTNCNTTFNCGSISNVTFPFTGGDRPDYCGLPEFKLSCIPNNVTELTHNSVTYRVLRLDQTLRTLTLSRSDLYNNTCPPGFINSTFNPTFFSYGDQNVGVLTLIYECNTTAMTMRPSNLFNCKIPGSDFTNAYFIFRPIPSDPVSRFVNCSVSVTVPMMSSVGGMLMSNETSLAEALMQGLSVNYTDPYENLCSECTRVGGQCGFDSGSGPPVCVCGDKLCELPALAPSAEGSPNTSATLQECRDCSGSGGRCGYNTNSNSFACYCSDRAYERVCNGTGRNSRINLRTGILISIGIVGIVLAVCIIYYCLAKRSSLWEALICWKLDDGNSQHIEAFLKNFGSTAPKHYNYSEIKRITNSFADQLGHGGYGSVYKGKLSDGSQVAVKLLNDNKGNGEEFINEVASISRTSHVNVVTLLGFCYNRNKRALIYEFMPNGSLDGFICKKRSLQDHITTESRLEWKTLYEISIGIARGLEYLHRGCNTRIVHFDIKPHNILLDTDFCPKISDFGLAKLCERKQSILSMNGARGTIGYIAPEVFCPNFGGVSHKSDVYSYGMVLLEIVGLRKKVETGSEQLSSEKFFPNWIYEHLERRKELEIQDPTNEEEEENSRKMILVGLWCIQTNPADRPSMSKVVEMLEGSLEHLQIPPKPFLDSPPVARKSIQESWTSSIS